MDIQALFRSITLMDRCPCDMCQKEKEHLIEKLEKLQKENANSRTDIAETSSGQYEI